MKVVSVAVFLLVGLTFVVPEPSCPSSSDILPCICTDSATQGLVMDCSLVKDEPELAHAFTGYFPTSDFHELRIIHDPMNLTQGLYSLETSTLGEATFQRITIIGTQIISIDGYAFDKSRSTLEVLALDGNRIHDFSFGSLASYTSLTSVLLAYNNLTVIQQIVSPFLEFLDMSGNTELVVEEKAFTYSPSLRKINLSNSKQQSLERDLFTELGQLQKLYLSNNDLKKLEQAAIVTPNASITHLDLSKNEISFVRHDSIVGLASNAILVMEENKIELLTQTHWQHVFDQMGNNGVINLAENPLVCGCDIAWIVLNQTRLSLLTDTTTCVTGERVIFLDPNIFTILCT